MASDESRWKPGWTVRKRPTPTRPPTPPTSGDMDIAMMRDNVRQLETWFRQASLNPGHLNRFQFTKQEPRFEPVDVRRGTVSVQGSPFAQGSVLHLALYYAAVNAFRWLTDRHVDPNLFDRTDANGRTPLVYLNHLIDEYRKRMAPSEDAWVTGQRPRATPTDNMYEQSLFVMREVLQRAMKSALEHGFMSDDDSDEDEADTMREWVNACIAGNRVDAFRKICTQFPTWHQQITHDELRDMSQRSQELGHTELSDLIASAMYT